MQQLPQMLSFLHQFSLEGDNEYCVVLLAPTSNAYEAWISRMGDTTIETQSLPDSESVVVSQQYIGGSLFKSQNGSIWTPSQFEDMKIKLNKISLQQLMLQHSSIIQN